LREFPERYALRNEEVTNGRASAELSNQEIPRSVKDEHVQTCEYWFCKRCLTIMLKTERNAHLQKCERWCCGRSSQIDHDSNNNSESMDE
jgi:hypothetical protein